jgi:hypothetical protein
LVEHQARHVIDYARGKFAVERYPLAPALKPIRETLAKLDPKPKPEPPAPKRPIRPWISSSVRLSDMALQIYANARYLQRIVGLLGRAAICRMKHSLTSRPLEQAMFLPLSGSAHGK